MKKIAQILIWLNKVICIGVATGGLGGGDDLKFHQVTLGQGQAASNTL